jgi:hypothetical protein
LAIKSDYPNAIKTELRDECYVMAMIPIFREIYDCQYKEKDSYKPLYTKIKEYPLLEKFAFGVLTGADSGDIPPVTLCYEEGDIFIVETYTY